MYTRAHECTYIFSLELGFHNEPSRASHAHVQGSLGWAEQTAQYNNTKADWVRKGQILVQMAFWTGLGVFEEPGHPPGPQPAPPFAAPFSLVWTITGYLCLYDGTIPILRSSSASWTYSISVYLSCRCQLVKRVCVRECVGECECACRHVCFPSPVSIWSGVWPEQITEVQWASWNSCGKKLSSYAIRFGYSNTVCHICLC